MQIINDIALSWDDYIIHSGYSDLNSRSDVDITTINTTAPIISSPMYHLGTKAMMQYFHDNKLMYVIHRYFPSAKEQLDFYCNVFNDKISPYIYFAVGSNTSWLDYLLDQGMEKYCVDMSHGNSKQCINTISYLINHGIHPENIMAGNVESSDGVKRLYEAGARYIRICLASGSICSTNKNTGIGIPIITALSNCNNYAYDKKDCHLIVDGGVRTAADIAKALLFGADYVMCGKLFASTSLARGPFFDINMNKLIYKNNLFEYFSMCGDPIENATYVEYAGMASQLMREQSKSQKINVSEEGMSGVIKYTGTTEKVISKLLLNLQATISYTGCKNINEFKENAIVQRISTAGYIEKSIHLDKIY